MDQVAGQKSVISITSNSGNVTGSYNNVWNNCDISVSEEKRAVLEWLSPTEPRERHQAIRVDRLAGVGGWLLLTNEFTRWNQSGDETAHPVLFCYGDPGVGKTYLSSLVIDKLCDEADANIAVVCVYCDFRAQEEQSATGILGTLLKQVVSGLEPIPEEVQRAFEKSKRGVGGRRLLLPDILEILVKSLSHLRRAFICIDALDEFPAKRRPEFWESLQRIMRQCPKTRLFLTGRPHVRGEVQKYFPSTVEMLPVGTKTHDIGLYLRMRLDRDPESSVMNQELEADILRIIPQMISRTFLFVSLNMDAILAEVTIHQRRQALHRMTKGLGLQGAYDTTLDRIRQQGGSRARLGMEALMWVSGCERPLKSQELCHALGVERGAEDFNTENVPLIDTLLSCALGLVTIGERESTPRLLHFTLHEYLRQHPTLFITAGSMMAEICLTYLNSQLVRALPPDLEDAPETAPFLEYAACFWGTHAARGMTELAKSLALRLLDRHESHVSAAVLWRKKICKGEMLGYVRGISGLHCVAFWGIAEIAIAILETERWQVNGCDSWSETPLMWAVKYGNSRMVELFLAQEDIEPNMVTRQGCTALSFAAELGNEDVVKILLDCGGVNPDLPDKRGQTPLSFAAEGGHGGVVKLFLRREDTNPNSSDSGGQTPLSLSAERGHKEVVKLLVEHEGVNPNLRDSKGRTPLSLAASWGRGEAVKLLLEREDVDPNSSDEQGRTPLSFAVEGCGPTVFWRLGSAQPPPASRKDGVVKLLLERGDLNPNLSDCDGRTPLSWATLWGHGGIVKLLLQRGDVNPNLPDRDGRTLVSLAAMKGHEGVMKLLLEHRDVNSNLPDRNRRTPLSWAASEGHEGVVKLLLQRADVNPDSSDSNGQTPLLFAAVNGKQGVVKLLLRHGNVNPNSPDRDGRTPLSFAAWGGREGVVKLLLERGDLNLNSSDNWGRTPLSFAAGGPVRTQSHYFVRDPSFAALKNGVAKLLLEHGDVNPNSSDINGLTPLSFAAAEGNDGVVRLLLERGDVNPNSPDIDGRTPLSFAAEGGHTAAVKLLQQRADVNPSSPDNCGRTPMLFAASRGHEGIVKLLLEHRDANPNSPDSNFRTPISIAAQGGHNALVKLLLEREDVNPNSPDSNGRTPLSFAAEERHEGVVKLLLQRGDVDPNLSDSQGRTPLSFAARRPILRMFHNNVSARSLPVFRNDGIVRLVPERRDVNPESPDSNSRPPLLFAAEERHESVVKLLLQHRDVNPNSADSDGRTPLSIAAETGREGVVKLLLVREDVDPNSADSDGRTPLSFAAGRGREGVVKLLLERGDVDPNSADSDGRTPLLFAALEGHGDVVKQLLERGDVDPNLADSDGRTSLSFAAERGREGVAKLLFGREDVDLNSPDNNCRTPLSFAAKRGPKSIVKLFLEQGDVDPNSADSKGQTPLLFAAERGREGVVKLLLERGDVNPNLPDSDGRTPLSFAAERGHQGVVKLLLERGDVDPTSPDSTGQRPLSYAAMKGQEGVVGLLSGFGIPDGRSSENRCRAPISVTAENASRKEVAYPLTAAEPITHAPDTPPSDSPKPSLEQPLPLKQSPPDQLRSPLTPSAAIPSHCSCSAFPFFLWAFILFIFLFSTLMIYHRYGILLNYFTSSAESSSN